MTCVSGVFSGTLQGCGGISFSGGMKTPPTIPVATLATNSTNISRRTIPYQVLFLPKAHHKPKTSPSQTRSYTKQRFAPASLWLMPVMLC
ncbi:hypothetical protein GN956_G22409 [Arapaima gigas]